MIDNGLVANDTKTLSQGEKFFKVFQKYGIDRYLTVHNGDIESIMN